MQGGGPEKRGCRCWKSLLLHPTGGKERGIRGSEKGWREFKKSTSGGEGGESDQCWQLKSSDYNRREQRRGERMDQSSDGEYERREEKCRGSTAGWALRLSPGAQGTTAHSPTLSLTFFSLTHSRLSFSPSDRELSLAVVSLWPSPLSPTAGTWLDDTAQHCIAGEGRHQPPTHTHTQTNLTKTTLFSIPPLCLSITIALACYSTMLHLLIFARKHQCCSLLCNHQTLLIERQTFKLLDDSCNGEGIS